MSPPAPSDPHRLIHGGNPAAVLAYSQAVIPTRRSAPSCSSAPEPPTSTWPTPCANSRKLGVSGRVQAASLAERAACCPPGGPRP